MIPTHISNHTLDLIITRSSGDLVVEPPFSTLFVNPHFFVECLLSLPRPSLSKKLIRYRNFKQVDVNALKNDISLSQLSNLYSSINLDQLCTCYQETISTLIDDHAPLKEKLTVVRTEVPWFSSSLRDLKRKRRNLERQIFSGRVVAADAARERYRAVRNEYSFLHKQARTAYYTDKLNACAGDTENCSKLSILCAKLKKLPVCHRMMTLLNWQTTLENSLPKR